MTIDPDKRAELLMAYADGELDAVTTKRIEAEMARDPEIAAEIAKHRALRDRLGAHFAPVADAPVPDRLTALLARNVVDFPTRRARRSIGSYWKEASALAACLVVGLSLGLTLQRGAGPVTNKAGALYASGALANALDSQLASATGTVRVPVSFRDGTGAYCRVFDAGKTGGIACHDDEGWALRRTRAGADGNSATEFRQAGSADAALMAEAQEMMADAPLDAAQEKAAMEKGWR